LAADFRTIRFFAEHHGPTTDGGVVLTSCWTRAPGICAIWETLVPVKERSGRLLPYPFFTNNMAALSLARSSTGAEFANGSAKMIMDGNESFATSASVTASSITS